MATKAKIPAPQTHSQAVTCPKCQTSFSVAMAPPPAVRGHELTRRAKLLMENVKFAGFGRPICPLCDKPKQSLLSLQNHLRRDHFEELQDDMFFVHKPGTAC